MAKVFDDIFVKYKKNVLLSMLALYIFFNISWYSTINDYGSWKYIMYSIIIFTAVVLLSYIVYDIFSGKMKITPLFVISSLIAIVVAIVTFKPMFCFFIAFLYLFRDVKLGDVAKVASYTILVYFLVHIILITFGIISNPANTPRDHFRWSLGFNSTSAMPSILLLSFCVGYNYYKKHSISSAILFTELIFNVLFYYLTDSRAGFYLTLLVIFASFIVKFLNIKVIRDYFLKSKFFGKIVCFFNKDKTNKVLSALFACLPILFVCFFGILAYLYQFNFGLSVKFNELFSGRIFLIYNAFINYPITFFGGRYNWVTDTSYYGVDSGFFHIFFNCGIILTVLLLFVFMCVFYKSFRKKDYFVAFCMFIMLVESFSDVFMLYVTFNILLLYFNNCARLDRNYVDIDDDKVYGEKLILPAERGKEFDKDVNTLNNVIGNRGGYNKVASSTLETQGEKLESICKEDIEKNNGSTNQIINFKNCKVSIIVPVYNSEKYINKCIDKLLAIPLENVEIIAVYSTSSDNSLKILNKYRGKIKIIVNNTSGYVSKARNLGLKHAKGNYIAFVDVDDDFELNMFSKMLSIMIAQEADICVCGFDRVFEDGKKQNSKHDYTQFELNNQDGINQYLTDKISPYLWDKVFSKKIIEEIVFCEKVKISEDSLFCLQAFLKAQKTIVLEDVLYHYVQHTDSISKQSRNENCFDFIKTINYLPKASREFLEKEYAKVFNYYKNQMVIRALHTYIKSMNTKTNKKDMDILKQLCSKNRVKQILKDKLMPFKSRMEFVVVKFFGIKMYIKFVKIILRRK